MSDRPGASILDLSDLPSPDISDQYLDQISVNAVNMDFFSNMVSGSGTDVMTLTTNPNVSPGYLYTSSITGTDAASWTKPSSTLRLNGEDADIEINGVSLNETLKVLQDRLNILRPNAELESRWQELRELRQQYQRLELELQEKERAWEMLQSNSQPRKP